LLQNNVSTKLLQCLIVFTFYTITVQFNMMESTDTPIETLNDEIKKITGSLNDLKLGSFVATFIVSALTNFFYSEPRVIPETCKA
jgi:hypothetical protein